MNETPHSPVMLKEVVHYLGGPRPGQIIVDATLGSGGYSEVFLEKMNGEGLVMGLDQDEKALELARNRLAGWDDSFIACKANFVEIPEIMNQHGIDKVDAIVADLGVSSMQIDEPFRGFSFQKDGPLDMRMDTEAPLTAADVINTSSLPTLEKIFRDFGEERFSRRIAKAIINRRNRRKFNKTLDLADFVKEIVPGHQKKIHKATRVFQALRIAVNHELENLVMLCEKAPGLLKDGGVFICVSYHSLEDRIVKQQLKRKREHPVWEILTKKPLTPTEEEIARNPRSRSAKLRAALKRT